MGMNEIMRQAQMMQKKIAKAQEEVDAKEIEVTSGGGMVTVRINGKQEILDIKIDPTVMSDGDIEMLQDLILSATNEAIKRIKTITEEEMKGATGGFNIPGMF